MGESEQPLIRLRQVGKSYPIATSGADRLRTLMSLLAGRPVTPRHDAVANVSLQVFRGQSLGLIGENGAGKSTLLKMIAGVVQQSTGTVEINGKVGALLELGAGFHPDYSGRENVFLASALIGASRQETLAHLDDILAFADIGEYIDQPIKHYSSGMVVRLGFAIATTMRPDILITDEVLAVGDESFQKKCVAWMERYLADGGTLLLCSHSMFHIQKLCRQAAWIHHGRLHSYGDSADVAREYLAYHEEKGRAGKPNVSAPVRGLDGEYRVESLVLNDGAFTDSLAMLAAGDSLEAAITVHSPDGRTPNLAVGVVRADGSPVYGVVSEMENYVPERLDAHRFGFRVRFHPLTLLPGRYLLRTHAMDPEGMRLFDHVEVPFDIVGGTRELGICRLPHDWHSFSRRA